MGILVDTNVFIDVLNPDPVWVQWSGDELRKHGRTAGNLVLSPIVYAELCSGRDASTILEFCHQSGVIRREDFPFEAAELAGRAFRTYLSRGGTRRSVLADFLIGAHAVHMGHALLTRDPKRYASAFPGLAIIAP